MRNSKWFIPASFFIILAIVSVAFAPAILRAVGICANPALVGIDPISKNSIWTCGPATGTPAVSISATLAPTDTATPVPPTVTNTNVPATSTALPSATSTLAPTNTPTPSPTFVPTAPITATVVVQGLRPVNALLLGSCSAAVHDRYATVVNGVTYRTWHPQIVPLDPADPSKGSCAFAHEHGDDPHLSLANATLPPFELIADLAGLVEPHEGYKVFVQNKGSVNDDHRTALTSGRMVVHMGTDGATRFFVQFHSLMIDVVAPDGHFVHVQGLGDFGDANQVSNICVLQRTAKTAMSIPGLDGCVPQSDYEIWQGSFTVHSGKVSIVTALAAPAVFDPISLRNPNDLPGQHFLNLTKTFAALAPKVFGNGPWKGCKREGYVGPVYWYNGGTEGQTQFTTDVYGQVMAGGPLLQQISLHTSIGIPMTTDFGISPDQTQFKNPSNNCANAALLGDLN